jgi:single-stranded DNA-specific DHH superfamily exonuclease
VDCGITAVDEVAYAREKGIDVVITDHHACKETLPPAVAVVDPHHPDCPYPFKGLAGVGVALKLALAVADRVWMLGNSVYSVISPEGCASILWKDASKADVAAESLKLTAEDAKSLGVIERILSEDDMGQKEFYDRIRVLLADELEELSRDPDLLAKRYLRFRRLGQVREDGLMG